MNALFLQDLADKTRRVFRGRIQAGTSGGGLCYGYDVIKRVDENGEPIRGDRKINEAEAAIVQANLRRVRYRSLQPHHCAQAERRSVSPAQPIEAGDRARSMANRRRGTGILNNELYIGRLVWNRLRYVKDPDTGKRISRLNPESKWIVQEVPELRIIDQDLWDQAKARQSALEIEPKTKPSGKPLVDRRRPRYLFSGLIKCGCCGGGFSMISQSLLGCSTARNKNTCDNRLTIKREVGRAAHSDGAQGTLDGAGAIRRVLPGVHQGDEPLAHGGVSLARRQARRARQDRATATEAFGGAPGRRRQQDDRQEHAGAGSATGSTGGRAVAGRQPAAAAASQHGGGLSPPDQRAACGVDQRQTARPKRRRSFGR